MLGFWANLRLGLNWVLNILFIITSQFQAYERPDIYASDQVPATNMAIFIYSLEGTRFKPLPLLVKTLQFNLLLPLLDHFGKSDNSA